MPRVSELMSQNISNSIVNFNTWGSIIINVKAFGAVGDGETDDSEAFFKAIQSASELGGLIVIPNPKVAYRVSYLSFVPGVNVCGLGNPRIDLFGSNQVLLGLKSNSVYENIWFNCIVPDREWNRGDLANQSNVIIRNCRFEGFRHTSGGPNAWGVYLDESSNITIDNCEFENNSQSDIAIVEGCKNITIVNARGSNLFLNVEPNGPDPAIENVVVIGGKYKYVNLIENSVLAYCVKSIVFEGCDIGTLNYVGASASFVNTRIGAVTQGFNLLISGTVDFGGSVTLGENLISDDRIIDIGNVSGSSSYWVPQYVSTNNMLERVSDAKYGQMLVFNPEHKTGQQIFIRTRNDIAVDTAKTYAISSTSYAQYPTGATFIGYNIRLEYRDTGGNLLSFRNVITDRGTLGSTTNLNTEIAIFKPPSGAVNVRVLITAGSYSAGVPTSLHIAHLGVYEVTCGTVSDNANVFSIDNLSGRSNVYAPAAPGAVTGNTTTQLKGQIVYNNNPSASGYIGWVCTASGNPGTWKGFGAIEA